MRKSARVLGQNYGLTSQEMNFVLREEGFLKGESGNYIVSEKGKNFAGDGKTSYGYANGNWTTRVWDDGIADELVITENRKKEIRQAISIAKQKTNKLEDEGLAIESYSYEEEGATDANDDALVEAVTTLLILGAVYGINKAAPYINNWWNDKVVPSLKKMKNKGTGKVEKKQEETELDAALEPIVNQIKDLEKKESAARSAMSSAQKFEKELSDADNSYKRAMVHQACESRFGIGSPRKIISELDAEIQRINRDLTKLHTRANNIAEKAARDIQKLVLDGNNLCYEGDSFLGLDALRVLVPILADSYEITVVFDASIRRALSSGDSDIRNAFGENVKAHVVATSVKADETVLDLAGFDKTAFIISNDRFAEFGEKAAMRDQRIIRHEIVAGKVMIHDLGVSETYRE